MVKFKLSPTSNKICLCNKIHGILDYRHCIDLDNRDLYTGVLSLKYNVADGSKPDNLIIFKDNSAANGGSNIYGTSIKSNCLVSPDGQNASYEVQADFFQFDKSSKINHSSVSSNPKRVCLCDDNGIPMCANLSYIIQHIIKRLLLVRSSICQFGTGW